MTEETQVSDTQPEVNFEDTIDSIASEFNAAPVEPTQPYKAPTTEQMAQPSVPQPFIPDPLDQNQFGQFVQQQNQTASSLTSQVQQLSEKLTQYEQREAQQRVETEIKSAVSKVNDGLGFDESLVRAHLESVAATNPSFQKIWDNRNSNPKALDKALNAVKMQMKDKWAVRPDPELIENQNAAKRSQQSLASKGGSGDEYTDRLSEAKTEAQFQREWARLRSEGF